MFSFLSFLIPWGVIFVNILIAIPFLTLLERKVIGYIQSRKGPNKVSYLGLLQPIADGGKLIFKELGTPNLANILLFWLSPILSFLLMVLGWSLFPSYFNNYFVSLGIVLFLCIASLQVYTLLGSGWGSNSKYALLGSVRGAAQTISYEVALIIVIFLPCCLNSSYSFIDYLYKDYLYVFILGPIVVIWLVSSLAETNRAPFDFAEGESELVSGFNIEYSAFEFACLFLSEYGNILLMSFLTAILFFSSGNGIYIVVGSIFTFSFLWIRSALPRFRYDLLMHLAWKVFLPVSLFYIFLVALI
uniref:NADH-ubiquinone oxidoreductase chain 1 n=1 Tax=Enchiridium sp. MTA_2015 TaxID=1712692 RepID=A0A0N7HUN9_9PLAT|nr:NADH dehydrogenase subunit 1 [Enchiridium sp. MTA_2015]ALI86932.1 NADH dehydrogenase subunit 1 [Enchiridium sp. MTA_2015]